MELISLGVLLIGIIPGSVTFIFDTRMEFRFNESRWYSSSNASANVAAQCEKKISNCACLTDQGLVDLSQIDSKDPTKPRFQADDVERVPIRYYYNPCTPFNSGQCKGAAVCRCDQIEFFVPPRCSVIGLHAKDEFRVENERLTIIYSESVTKSHISLICGQSKQPDADFALQRHSLNDYYFTLTSKHACAVALPRRGLSMGSLLVIGFLSLLILYLVGGILFKHYVTEAEGFDRVPNLDFWQEFPILVKDGVVFTFSSLRERCCSTPPPAYRQI